MEKTDHQADENGVDVSQEFFNIKDLSRDLGIKTGTLYTMVEERSIPHYRVGKLIRFKRSEIDEWMEGNRKECVDPQKAAKKVLAPVQKPKIDVGRLVRKAIDRARGPEYTPSCGKTRPSQRPQKGGL